MKKSLLLVLALVLAGCGKGGGNAEPQTAAASADSRSKKIELSADAQKIAEIKTEAVKFEMVQDGLDVPGVVNSTTKGRAVVTPPVAGRVVSIKVQLGEKVSQGQTLAVIESSELAQTWTSVAQARHARDAAIAELNESVSEAELAREKLSASKTNLVRQRELAKAGAFSQAPLQQAKSELNDAQSDLLGTQKELATHSESLRRTENLFKDGLVAKADLDQARLEVQQDQIRLERDRARVESAKTTFERESGISQKGLLNAKEVQSAEAEVRAAMIGGQTAQIKVRSARAAKANAERAIANAQATYRASSGSGSASVGQVALVAPISGTVTHLDITRGQAVERTQVLLEVENLNSVWVTANVPEKDAAKVQTNAPITVKVAALPGREFHGFVQIVGGHIESKTRSIPVQCLIASADGALVPDMFATVHLGVGTSIRRLTVPRSAVVSEDRKAFVFVKVDGKFEKREVALGSEMGDSVALKSGLKEGEIVAVKGAFVLQSESKKDELKGEE